MVDAVLNYIWQWISWIGSRLVDYLTEIYNSLVSWIGQIFGDLVEWFGNVFGAIFEYIDAIIEQLNAYFSSILDAISEAVSGIWTAFEELTTDVIDAITDWLTDAASEVSAFIDGLVEDVSGWLESAVSAIGDLVDSAIRSVGNIADQVSETVTGWFDAVMKSIEKTYTAMLNKIDLAFDAFIGGVGSFIESIESRLSELKTAFADAAIEVVQGLTELADETITPIKEKFTAFIDDLIPDTDPAEATEFITQAKKLTEGNASPQEYRDFVSNMWMSSTPKTSFWYHLLFTLIGWLGGAMLIAQLTGVQAEIYMHQYGREFPYQIFSPADATAAWRKGLISETDAVDTIRMHGFSEENAKVVLDLSKQVPTEGDLLLLYHRGLIDDATLEKAFFQQGLDKEYIANLKEASFLIPPVSDLITMAVREAFSPQIAERFGQYEDYPEDLTEWTEKQALGREWAKRYWAAHWALPSPNQGFEMLHRGVIDKDDLNLLLRALDVMPFWRDNLIQIAYTPFTRIDIRRMHKVGVLTEEEVYRSYQDLGYDAEKAKKMTDFVMLLNAPEAADDEVELKDLSRANVVNFYSDGLITREDAMQHLITLGYTNDAAQLYLDSADLDEERSNRKAEVTLILSLAKAGVITFDEAENRLSRVGLETKEINKAIVDLLREREKRTKLPSRTEAERMAREGLIQRKDYEEFLGVLGYSEKWIKGYLGLLDKAGSQ